MDSSKVAGDTANADKQIRTIFERNQAEVLVSRPWDERRLSYPIRNQKKGLYYLTYFSAQGPSLPGIERDCTLNEMVLRQMILLIDPKLVDTMLSLAKGDYIQWLDADDLLSPDKVANQMAAAAKSESKRTLFSSGWGYFMHRPSNAQFSPTTLWCDLAPVEWMVRKWEGNHHMQTATWLVSRELSMAAGPWDTRLLGDDDGEYFSRVIRASDGIKFVPEAKVFYRITGSGRLSFIGRSNKKIDAQFLGMKTQIGYLRSMADNERVRSACVNYLQTWLIHFHPERPDIVEEARQIAAALGGQLTLPRLSWKYAWIKNIFGWSAAKSAQLNYNGHKTALKTKWDKAMARFERRQA